MTALAWLDPGDRAMGIAGLALLQSTAVIALAWLLARVAARGRPAPRHVIWLGALVSLALGPIAAILADRAGLAFVELPILRAAASSLAPAPPAAAVDDASTIAASPRPAWMSQLPIGAPGDAPAREAPRPVIDRTTFDRLRATCGLAFAAWAVVAAALAIRLAAGVFRLERLKRRASPLDEGPLGDVLDDVRATLGLRRLPRILVSDELDRPVAAGTLRAAVVLPATLLKAMGPQRLRDVLVHECAHVARRDHLVGLLQRAAGVAYWPQPMILLLDRELSRAREELCDNHVLHGGDRLAYSWTLLEVAEVADGPARFSTASGLLSSSWRLEDRIAGILDDGRDLMTRSNRRASLLVAAGFAAATAGFATLAPAGDGPADAAVSGAVDRMAEKLRQGPLDRPADDEERAGVYLLDLADGKSTLITDEPGPGLRNCGSPRWSPDGRRILLDASTGKNWRETRLKSIDLGDDRLKIADLGLGNCPSFSPDGQQVAFLSNSHEPGNQPLGIWIMRGDGSGRRPMNVYGAPQWSPDGRKILVIHFGSPVEVGVLDVATGVERPLVFPGYRIHPSPRWAGPETVVASATTEEGAAVALFDVSDPANCTVKEVLWKRGDRLDTDPTYPVLALYPVFSPATGRCVFVARTHVGLGLYSVQRGSFGPPRELERPTPDRRLAGLEFSPDGRFLLYCSDRPAPQAP